MAGALRREAADGVISTVADHHRLATFLQRQTKLRLRPEHRVRRRVSTCQGVTLRVNPLVLLSRKRADGCLERQSNVCVGMT